MDLNLPVILRNFLSRDMLMRGLNAGIAQLVEYKLPKLGVAGSNPVARSMRAIKIPDSLFEVIGHKLMNG